MRAGESFRRAPAARTRPTSASAIRLGPVGTMVIGYAGTVEPRGFACPTLRQEQPQGDLDRYLAGRQRQRHQRLTVWKSCRAPRHIVARHQPNGVIPIWRIAIDAPVFPASAQATGARQKRKGSATTLNAIVLTSTMNKLGTTSLCSGVARKNGGLSAASHASPIRAPFITSSSGSTKIHLARSAHRGPSRRKD